MTVQLPPPPNNMDPKSPAFRDWFYKIRDAFSAVGTILFTNLDFTGSNITSILTRNHSDLQNLNTASYTHLTSTQATDLTDGGDSTLHYHASDRDSANFTGTDWSDLTDSGDSTLHYHSSDRSLANATGTLDETNGGTGNITYTTGDILYASAADTLSKLPIGTEGQGLKVSAGGIPEWGAVATSSKIYEPSVVAGFFTNVTYTASEPKLPEFVTDSNGDIVMAWGGSYAS